VEVDLELVVSLIKLLFDENSIEPLFEAFESLFEAFESLFEALESRFEALLYPQL
jgi:hypothetical protein